MDLIVGTYSLGDDAKGEGIYGVSFDVMTGGFGAPRLLVGCVNPSWITLSSDGRMLFAAREVMAADHPGLLSLRRDPAGQLERLSEVSFPGELPCHVAYDPVHRRVASAQYWTGDIAICGIRDDGLATPIIVPRKGHGPNPRRQDGPHAHFVAFTDGGDVLHTVDLGTDRVVSHRLGADGRPVETTEVALPAGSGPRHMHLCRDGVRAFVFCELDETIVSIVRNGLGWDVAGVVTGFERPADVEGAGAEIRLSPDERFAYVSGRRQSRIAWFSVEGTHLTRQGDIECGGTWPRDFIATPDGDWLIVANQHSDSLTSLRRDPNSGRVSAAVARIAIGSPVAVIVG